jgi:hypothetical protein
MIEKKTATGVRRGAVVVRSLSWEGVCILNDASESYHKMSRQTQQSGFYGRVNHHEICRSHIVRERMYMSSKTYSSQQGDLSTFSVENSPKGRQP